MDRPKDDSEDQEIVGIRKLKDLDSISQEDIELTTGNNGGVHFSTDNVTGLEGTGSDEVTALMDHIVELVLFYEEKLRA